MNDSERAEYEEEIGRPLTAEEVTAIDRIGSRMHERVTLAAMSGRFGSYIGAKALYPDYIDDSGIKS